MPTSVSGAAALARVALRELRWWSKHPRGAAALGIYPMAVLAVLAAAFSGGVPEQLPIGVVDHDHSSLSRGIIRAVDATQAVEVTVRSDDVAGVERAMLQGRIYAAVVLPRDLERDAIGGARPTIAVYFDNQHMTAGGTALAGIRAAIAQQGLVLSADLLRQTGANPGPISLNAVQSVSEVLFNPQRNYTYFLLVSMAPAVLQLFAAIGAAVAVGREFRAGRQAGWRRAAGARPGVAMAGKLLPYFLLLLAVALSWLAVATRLLDVPMRGSPLFVIAGTVLFLLATLGAGAFIAALSPTLPKALALCTLYVSPTFAYSGTAFPVTAMPALARVYREFLPLSPYLELTVDQTIRGSPIVWSMGSLLQLAVMAAILLGFASVLLGRRWRAKS